MPLSRFKTTLSVLKNCLDLLELDAREPFQKFLDRRTAFNILKQRFHRDASCFKQPGAADLSSNAFNSRAL